MDAICECGLVKEYLFQNILQGRTRSCGCFNLEKTKERSVTHGESFSVGNSAEYRTWKSIRMRCYSINSQSYDYYGGRGICMSDEWRNSYVAFLNDMGRKPIVENVRYSIERKNVNGNYCKENCYWGDDEIQANNKTTSHFIEYLGEIKTVAQWAKIYNIPTSNFHTRLKSCNFNLDIYNLKWQTNLTYLKETA